MRTSKGRAGLTNPGEAKKSNAAYVKKFCNTMHAPSCGLCVSRSTHKHTHTELPEGHKNITTEQKYSDKVVLEKENWLFG